MITLKDQMNALIHIKENLLDKNGEFSISAAIKDPYIVYIFSTRDSLLTEIQGLVKEGTLRQITQFKFTFN